MVHEDRKPVSGDGLRSIVVSGLTAVPQDLCRSLRRRQCGLGGELDHFWRTAAKRNKRETITAEELNAIKRCPEFLDEAERRSPGKCLANDLRTKRKVPVKAGSIRLVDDEVRMCCEKMTTGLESVGYLAGNALQRLIVTDIVEHLATHDEVEATGKRVPSQIKPFTAYVLQASATLDCPVQRNLRNIGSDEHADTRGKLYGKMTFCTGKF
jgi:hypothetical protein